MGRAGSAQSSRIAISGVCMEISHSPLAMPNIPSMQSNLGGESDATEQQDNRTQVQPIYFVLVAVIVAMFVLFRTRKAARVGEAKLANNATPSDSQERAARAARLARFGCTDDMPSEDELRTRKTISIAQRNSAIAARAAAEKQAKAESRPKRGTIMDSKRDKNNYWNGDSTVFEDRDD